MKYTNKVYTKVGQLLEFDSNENLSKQLEFVEDWNVGTINLIGKTQVTIPKKEVAFIETEVNEEQGNENI